MVAGDVVAGGVVAAIVTGDLVKGRVPMLGPLVAAEVAPPGFGPTDV